MIWELVDGDLPKWAAMSWYWTSLHFPEHFSKVCGAGKSMFAVTPSGCKRCSPLPYVLLHWSVRQAMLFLLDC